MPKESIRFENKEVWRPCKLHCRFNRIIESTKTMKILIRQASEGQRISGISYDPYMLHAPKSAQYSLTYIESQTRCGPMAPFEALMAPNDQDDVGAHGI